jgi:2-C-methyl-D-erythritol 4-phosphate cytidylyltransferase
MTETLGAIIVAAGSGERMRGVDKLFTEVAGRSLLAHTIAPFQECAAVLSIVVVLSPQNLKRGRDVVQQFGLSKVEQLVHGGARRQDSVRSGLEALAPCDYVAVHDGGRPLATPALIERGLAAARETGAAVPGIRIPDTVKEAGEEDLVTRTVDRSRLWAVQTPQVFRRELLERAHREISSDVTDDAAMVEALGEAVRVFEGDRRNLKVTVAEDIELVRALLERNVTASAGATSTQSLSK